MNEISKDQRFFPRVTVSLDGFVKCSEKQIVFKTVDLTVEGISFQFELELAVGTQIVIHFDGSEEIEHNELKAEILRCEPLKNSNPFKYVLAAKFIDANDRFLMDSLALVHSKKKK